MARPKIKILQDRKASLYKAMQKLHDEADGREEPGMTPDEEAKYAEHKTELEAVKVQLAREEELAQYERELAPVIYSSPAPAEVTNARPAFLEDPQRGFRSTQEFFRQVMFECQAQPSGPINPQNVRDERLRYLVTAGSDEHGGYSNPYGGFLVPSGFLPNLLQVQAEGDPTAGRTMSIPMATNSVEIPARTDKTHTSSVSGGLLVYRRSETQTVTSSRMEVERIRLTATSLMGLSYATEELISDSAISFVALLEAGFRDEFATRILREKISGTGAGQYEGVINAPCLVTVTKETGQAADTINYQNVIKMRSRCWGYGNAIWLANHDTLPQLMQMSLTVGTGGTAMWQTSAREGEPDMLLGRPIYTTEFCPKLGDLGDLICGNWSQYLEGTLKPLEGAESLHVRFEYNERTFRFLMRNDGKCWWRAALTPHKATDTLGPFVVLQAR